MLDYEQPDKTIVQAACGAAFPRARTRRIPHKEKNVIAKYVTDVTGVVEIWKIPTSISQKITV